MSGTIEEKLSELEIKYQAIEAEIGGKIRDKDNLKADISDLKKIVAEVSQVVGNYKKVCGKIKEEKGAIEDYNQKKKAMIEAAINDSEKQDKIESKISEVEADIKSKEGQLNNIESKFKAAKTELEDAKTDLNNKQIKYDKLKTYQKDIEEYIKNLKNLRMLIEKEEDDGNFPNMYFYSTEIEGNVGFAIMAEGELSSALYKAWQELDIAKLELREKDDKMKVAKINLETGQKEIELIKSKRRENILEKLKEL